MAVALDPEMMTAEERLQEVAHILAAGLLRLRHRQAGESRFSRENCLEVPAETRLSVAVNARKGGIVWN